MKTRNKLSRATKRFLAGAAVLAVATASVLGYTVVTNQNVTADAATCRSNNIMPCGASDPASFIAKAKANAKGDYPAIYGAYKLPTSEYNRFATQAKAGSINSSKNNVTVNGIPVASGIYSLGRDARSMKVSIGGKTYYETPSLTELNGGSAKSMVLFDKEGRAQTIIMNTCGNPQRFTPVHPAYNCSRLNATPVNNIDTWTFSSSVWMRDAGENKVRVTKVVYNFGDGTTVTKTNPAEIVTHKYAKPGNYNASVTAYVKTTFSASEFPLTILETCKRVIPVKEVPAPKITLTKHVDGVKNKQVKLNTNFNYNLKVTNTGNVDLVNAVMTDVAPANVQFVSTDKGTVTNNRLNYTIPSLAKGQSITINITAKVTKYVSTSILNRACVDTPTVPGGPDACDEATVTVEQPKTPAITIDKLVNGKNSDAVEVNKSFVYTLKVTNTGQTELVNAVVTDVAPANTQFISTDKGTVTNNRLNYTIPKLAIGQSIEIKITAKVTQYVSTAIVNKACVDTPTVPGGPDACDEVPVTVKKPNIKIEKFVNGKKSDSVEVNKPYTYTLKVTNNGQAELLNAVVTDPAPANVEFISTDKGSVAGNKLTYTIPKLAVGESVEIKITAKVTKQTDKPIVNEACVDTTTIPGTPDNCDDVPVTVKTPGIAIEKFVNGKKSDVVEVDKPYIYTLKVTNTGQAELLNAVVTDPAPANVVFISTDKGSIVDNKLSYTIPSLAVGQSVEIKITAKVTKYVATAILNKACVDTPTIPGSPDDCDDVPVEVPKPNEVPVCDPSTGNIITVDEDKAGNYEPVDSAKCKTVPVCDPADGIIKDVKWTDKDKYESVDSDKCKKIEVCVIAEGTGAMTTISKDNFDASIHSTNAADCVKAPTPEIPQTPTVLPETGAGGVIGLFLGTSFVAGLAHRLFIGRKLAKQ